MTYEFSHLKPLDDPTDFMIYCYEALEADMKIYHFHKSYLKNISDVFKAMLENKATLEYRSGELKLIDCR